MSTDSLLDQMLADTTAGQSKVRTSRPGQEPPRPMKKLNIKQRETELGRRPYGADPSVNPRIYGMNVGAKIELFNGGPQIDGIWVIIQINPGSNPRHFYAAREGGSKPYIRVNEADFQEDVRVGNAKILTVGDK